MGRGQGERTEARLASTEGRPGRRSTCVAARLDLDRSVLAACGIPVSRVIGLRGDSGGLAAIGA